MHHRNKQGNKTNIRRCTTFNLITFFVVVFILVQLAHQTLAQSSDPRCAAHTCEVPKEYEIPEEFTSDDTTCAYGCPKCLVGPEWDQRRQELGTGSATRTFTPSLIFGDWLSTEMTETAFRILAEEMMDYKVDPVPAYVTGFDILCCERDIVYMEKWPGETYPNDDGYFSLSQIGVGYEGGSSIYVTQKTLDAYPLATAYNAYNHLPDYSNIFDRAGATPCGLGVLNETLGCVADNMQCTENEWTNTSCSADGRYVPPQCQGANYAQCQEILLMYPEYESGFFEGLIKNSGMKFSMFYVGYDNLISRVQELQKQGKHAIFYAYEPDPMIALLDAQPVTFKTPTAACRAKETSDPTTNGGDCDYGRQMLKKVARVSSLAKDSDFKYFFESFALTNTDLSNMISQHRNAGGDKKVYNITCEWLRNNYGTWKDWIRNTPPQQEAQENGVGVVSIVVPVVVASVSLLALCGVVAFLKFSSANDAAKVRNAPTEPPLTLLFTDVETSTSLWEKYRDDMNVAMDLHHKVIREVIEEHECYEVKTIGDSFMIACPTIIDGTMLALAIQRRLNIQAWPESLQNWKQSDGSDVLGFSTRVNKRPSVVSPAPEDGIQGPGTSNATSEITTTSVVPLTGHGSTSKNNSTGLSPRRSVVFPAATHSTPNSPSTNILDAANNASSSFCGHLEVWNGLRVRIGVHHCTDVEPKLETVNGRFDYYGPDVNIAARIEGLAQGGQIIMTQRTFETLASDPDFETCIGHEVQIAHFASEVPLKGVTDPVDLFSLVPVSLARRRFAPLEGYGVAQDVDGANTSSSRSRGGGGRNSVSPQTGASADEFPVDLGHNRPSSFMASSSLADVAPDTDAISMFSTNNIGAGTAGGDVGAAEIINDTKLSDLAQCVRVIFSNIPTLALKESVLEAIMKTRGIVDQTDVNIRTPRNAHSPRNANKKSTTFQRRLRLLIADVQKQLAPSSFASSSDGASLRGGSRHTSVVNPPLVFNNGLLHSCGHQQQLRDDSFDDDTVSHNSFQLGRIGSNRKGNHNSHNHQQHLSVMNGTSMSSSNNNAFVVTPAEQRIQSPAQWPNPLVSVISPASISSEGDPDKLVCEDTVQHIDA